MQQGYNLRYPSMKKSGEFFLLKLHSIIQLLRPADAASMFLVVLLGAYYAGHLETIAGWRAGLISGITGFLITAGTIALNDYYDLAIDRINKPDRPLPASRITPTAAKLIGLIFYCTGLMLSFTHGLPTLIFTGILIGLAHLYNRKLKKSILANFMVGFLCVCGLIYGLGNASISWHLFFPCLIIFSFITSREILKTVEDYQGDHQAGVVNFSTCFGVTAALQLYRVTSALVVLFTVLPFVLGQASVVYLFVIFLGLDLPILAGYWQLSRGYEPAQIRATLRLTKLSFFLGLFGLVLL